MDWNDNFDTMVSHIEIVQIIALLIFTLLIERSSGEF